MNYTPVLILIGILCTTAIKSSNILVFLPSPWKSHIISFQPLFLELAHRGHNVTVVTQFAVKNPPSNYTQVLMKSELNGQPVMDIILKDNSKLWHVLDELYIRSTITLGMTETFISNPVVQKFIKEDRSTFDLVIVESFYQECTVAMGHKYGAPVISIVPVAPWVSQSLRAANPLDFSYVKDFVLDAGKSLDFAGRLLNTVLGLYGSLVEPNVYLPKMETMMKEYFQYAGHESRPRLAEMLENVSLSLIDSDVMVLTPRPYVPNFVEVPGIHLRANAREMDEKLRDFMDRADAGVVYFSFGSLLDPAFLPRRFLDVFTNVLGRLRQKVVFKWSSNNDTRRFPDNFYVDSWLPQPEILKHRNCKAFVTHGGVHGLMETIDAGVPILGFPFFGDQFQNLRISQENGFGIMSYIFRMTEETFERDITLLLTDQKFTENAKKMSFIFHDRPMSTIDKAVYWVEYVIRHKGAHHLRSPAVDLKWYQFYLLDIAAFVMIIILICYFIIRYTMKLMYTLIVKQKKIKRS